MRVHVVDPSAYTPPYDHALCRALGAEGAEVELFTSRFAYGPVAVPEGYRRRELFYRAARFAPDGRGIVLLNTAEGGGAFDLTFIDADKQSIPEYFSFALKLSKPGSVIIVDNVVRDGRVIDAKSSDPDIQGIRRFNEMLAAEPRVSATAIQTVGAKGHDGFAIVLVTRNI